MKDRLLFDTTDADTMAETDNVGAFLRSADGTLITHTDVGGKMSLDVNVTSGINVEVDLAAADDSVSAWTKDGAGTAITSTLDSGKQGLDVNVINDLTVSDAALALTAIQSGAETLDTALTAQSAIASALADRKYVWLANVDNRTMFIGGAGVTIANGFPISPGSLMELRAGAAVDIQFVSEKVNHAIRSLQLS